MAPPRNLRRDSETHRAERLLVIKLFAVWRRDQRTISGSGNGAMTSTKPAVPLAAANRVAAWQQNWRRAGVLGAWLKGGAFVARARPMLMASSRRRQKQTSIIGVATDTAAV